MYLSIWGHHNLYRIKIIHEIYKYIKDDKYKVLYNINTSDNQVRGSHWSGCDEDVSGLQ